MITNDQINPTSSFARRSKKRNWWETMPQHFSHVHGPCVNVVVFDQSNNRTSGSFGTLVPIAKFQKEQDDYEAVIIRGNTTARCV